MNYHYKNEFQNKIKQLHEETTEYMNKIKQLLAASTPKVQIISYFTYSLNLSHEKEKESFIIGSYHLKNVSTKAITNPRICIKISPHSPLQFSGKYVHKNNHMKIKTTSSWERMNEQTDKEEFWLQPVEKRTVEPDETLTFSHFQLKWLPTTSYSGNVTGFTYCNELEKGVPAMNQISVSGSLKERRK